MAVIPEYMIIKAGDPLFLKKQEHCLISFDSGSIFQFDLSFKSIYQATKNIMELNYNKFS